MKANIPSTLLILAEITIMTNRIWLLFALALMMVDAAKAQLWVPYVEFGGRAGSSRELGQGNLFLPVWQDGESLLFADLRGQYTDVESAEANWGIAYRRMISNEWIGGIYGFYDLRHSQWGNNFQQATLGAELLGTAWGVRANGYLPNRASAFVAGSVPWAKIQGGTIVVQTEQERPYHGVDFEVEQLLWRRCAVCQCEPSGLGTAFENSWLSSLDAELWASAGLFHFDDHHPDFENMTGPRLRAELRLYDLPALGIDSRLVLGGEYRYDDVRGSSSAGMLTMRIPFGPGRSRSGRRLHGLNRRMVAPIVRDIDIVTHVGFVEEPAKFARTGEVIGNAVALNGNTLDAESVIEGAGLNSVVVIDGSAGTIFPAGTIDMPTGQVIMSGGFGLQVIGCKTGAMATFNAPGTRGILSNPNDVINTANNTSILGVNIISGRNGITLDSDRNVLIEHVVIDSSNRGIFADRNTQFRVNNSSINTSGFDATGILANHNNQFSVNHSTINTSGFSSEGLFAGNGNIFALNNSVINTTGSRSCGVFTFSNSDNSFAMNNSTINATGTGILAGASTHFSVNSSTITSGDVGIFSAFRFGGPSNVTITNNTIVAAGDEIVAGPFATQHLNITGNSLDGGKGTIRLDEMSGDINVTQGAPGSGPGSIDAVNGIPAGNVLIRGNPVDFNQPAPPLP